MERKKRTPLGRVQKIMAKRNEKRYKWQNRAKKSRRRVLASQAHIQSNEKEKMRAHNRTIAHSETETMMAPEKKYRI